MKTDKLFPDYHETVVQRPMVVKYIWETCVRVQDDKGVWYLVYVKYEYEFRKAELSNLVDKKSNQASRKSKVQPHAQRMQA